MADGLRDTVAVVTGGGTGIGAAVARQLSTRGVRVAINYAHSRDEAEALAEELGGSEAAVAIRADVALDADCRRLADEAERAFGRLDLLVNNAGRTKFAAHEDLEALDAEDFIEIYRLNAVAPFQMVRACAPAMRRHGQGAVVNVASVAGVFGNGSSIAYAASKGALVTMTKSLARVLAPAIRVNAVAPGYVGTGWFEKRLGEEGFAALNAKMAAATPMAMAAGAEDIAGPIVTLLDPAMRAVTGEVLLVDAGAHLDVGLSRRPGREL